MAPVFQDNHNPEPVITSSDAIGQLFSPPILWDRRATDLETAQDFGNADKLLVSVSNTTVFATPNHVLENEHFLDISPTGLSSLAARGYSASESPTDKAGEIIMVIILAVVAAFAVLGFLGFLGSICCGLSTEIKNQANNQSNILNTSSNTGETPNPPAPSIPKVRLPSRSYQYSSNDIEPQVCDSPPGYLNGIQE